MRQQRGGLGDSPQPPEARQIFKKLVICGSFAQSVKGRAENISVFKVLFLVFRNLNHSFMLRFVRNVDFLNPDTYLVPLKFLWHQRDWYWESQNEPLLGDFATPKRLPKNMPKGRKRKRKRRGKPTRLYKRSRRTGTFHGRKRAGGTRGYQRVGQHSIVPRTRGLFPFKIKMNLNWHDKFNMSTQAAGAAQTSHYRMNSINDPYIAGAGTKVSYYTQLAAIYKNYAVKSVFVRWKGRRLSTNNDAIPMRVWLFNDNTNTSAPSSTTIESFMDKRKPENNPMKWKFFTNEHRTFTLKAKFRPFEERTDGVLMRNHPTAFGANPSEVHNWAVMIDAPEGVGTNGVQTDLWGTFETIMWDPKEVAEVAAG